jgi:HK97 family phage major capsid protein
MTQEVIDAIQKELQKKIDELKEKMKQDAELNVKEDLQVHINNLNEKIEEMRGYSFTTTKQGSFLSPFVEKAAKAIPNFKQHGKQSFELELKSSPTAESMGLTSTTGAGVVVGDRIPGIHSEPARRPIMLDYILSGTTNSDKVTWVESTDKAGEPAFKKEFEEFPQRSWQTVQKTAYVKKMAVYSNFSREILEDLEGFQNELRRDLMERIQLILDTNILRGDEGGAAEAELKGILEYAQAWDNGTFTVADANVYDVIAVAKTQIKKEHHNPNVILMSPDTAMRMNLTKDDNGNYVAGKNELPVVTSTLLSDGEMLIMDGTKAQFKWRRNWTMEMTDSHDQDFTKDMFTVRLTGRGVLVIKDTDAKAFVHVTSVDDAITALTPSS